MVDLGLTVYEARAYWGLVQREVASVRELVQVTGLPKARAYDVLDRLVGRGLAVLRPGVTRQYAAVDPDVAMERLIAQQRRAFADFETRAHAAAERLRPSYEQGRQSRDPLDYIEVVRDPHALGDRVLDLQEGASFEVLMFVKPPFAITLEEGLARFESASNFRSIYEVSALDDPAYLDGVQRFIRAGEQARFVEHLPLKVGIIDEHIVLLSLEDPVAGQTSLTTLVVQHRSLAAILKIGFESVWDQALTLDQVLAARPRTSTSR